MVYWEHLLKYVNTVEVWTREGIEGDEVVITIPIPILTFSGQYDEDSDYRALSLQRIVTGR